MKHLPTSWPALWRPLSALALAALSGCSLLNEQLAAGIVFEREVAYPIRSPEYVLRDLGDQRYLLGQMAIDGRGERTHRTRFIDRPRNVSTRFDRPPVINRSADTLGDVPIRLASDDPGTIVFVDRGF